MTSRLRAERRRAKAKARAAALPPIGNYTQRIPPKPAAESGGPKPQKPYIPPPTTLPPLAQRRRRMIGRCMGVPKIGARAAIKCAKPIAFTARAGRPSVRCAECRVLKAWRMSFSYEDPLAVAETIRELAQRGKIGQGVRRSGGRKPKMIDDNTQSRKET